MVHRRPLMGAVISLIKQILRKRGGITEKKIIAIVLGLCVMLSLCGCSENAPEPQSESAEPRAAEVDLDAIMEAVEKELPKEGFEPEVGIVLGSGLHPLADEVEVVKTIPYEALPGFPHSTVAGHEGKFILGYLEGVPVILMDGRIHYYEGYTMEQVVTPDRVMARLGADTVILTNAVGSLKEELRPGTIACVKDHISSFIPNPLIGQNDEELGERFVPMADAYDEDLRKTAHEAAEELLPHVKKRVDEFVSDAPQFDDITMLGIKWNVFLNRQQ